MSTIPTTGCGGLELDSPIEVALRQVLVDKYKKRNHHHTYVNASEFIKDFPWCDGTIWTRAIEIGMLIPTQPPSYVFLQDLNPHILNVQYIPQQINTTDASTIITQLRREVLKLFGMFLSEDGNGVDYSRLRHDPEPLVLFNAIATQLCAVTIDSLASFSEPERKAFFLNLYNAMIIHAKVQIGNPTTIEERGVFFTKTAYRFDHIHDLTLDIIEHGILRANHPKGTAGSVLKRDSPLLTLVLTQLDPRIHFALNCGAKSCPSIRPYTASNMDKQLESAAGAFCSDSDNVRFDSSTGITHLSKIFMWYGSDFTVTGMTLLHAIASMLVGDNVAVLRAQLMVVASQDKIVFNDYNWEENSV